jgi:hypothetical protein
MTILAYKPSRKQHESAGQAARRWQPGEAIPKNYDPAPWQALVRNAEAHERWEREQAGRAFTVNCAEGRAVKFSICRACAKVYAFRPAAHPAKREERRAAA